MAGMQQEPTELDLSAQAGANFLEDPLDFSSVLGGPICQLFRKAHLAGNALQLMHRRLLISTVCMVAISPLPFRATIRAPAGYARHRAETKEYDSFSQPKLKTNSAYRYLRVRGRS
jgi:hypothetical protein